jgi:hypothetical protein
MINEVQPNPGGANAACPTCGALLSCLSCGNDLRAKEAELTRVLADLDRVSKERLASANALDAAQREIAAYRQSGVLEALRRSQRSGLKPGCDCEACRIELQRQSSIAALEAMEKLRATTGGLG